MTESTPVVLETTDTQPVPTARGEAVVRRSKHAKKHVLSALVSNIKSSLAAIWVRHKLSRKVKLFDWWTLRAHGIKLTTAGLHLRAL